MERTEDVGKNLGKHLHLRLAKLTAVEPYARDGEGVMSQSQGTEEREEQSHQPQRRGKVDADLGRAYSLSGR